MRRRSATSKHDRLSGVTCVLGNLQPGATATATPVIETRVGSSLTFGATLAALDVPPVSDSITVGVCRQACLAGAVSPSPAWLPRPL